MASSKSNGHLFLRILILALFIVLLNSWTLQHFGREIKQFSISNLVVVVYGVLNFFLEFYTSEEETKQSKIKAGLDAITNTPILISMFVLFLIIGSFVSSVSVSSDYKINKAVVVTPLNQKESKKSSARLTESNSEVRFTKFIAPFGNRFRLNVEGYQAYSFDLYPWVSKKIKINEDLQVSPSVIMRIPAELHRYLNKTRFDVYYNDSLIAKKETGTNGTLIIGKEIQIPIENIDRWIIELKSKLSEEKEVYKRLLTWIDDPLFIPYELEPFDTLDIKLVLDNNTVLTSARFSISVKEFQEIIMK